MLTYFAPRGLFKVFSPSDTYERGTKRVIGRSRELTTAKLMLIKVLLERGAPRQLHYMWSA